MDENITDMATLNKQASMDALSPSEWKFLRFARKLEREVAEKLNNVSGDMITSKELDHFEKFDIFEVERYPIHYTEDMVMNQISTSKWMDLGVEMRVMTIGQFRSLLLPM